MQQQCRHAKSGLAVAVVFALGAFGCNGAKSTASRPAPRWEGVTVHVVAAAGRPRSLIDRLGRPWAKVTGTNLEIAAPSGEWPAADVVLIPAPDLARWVVAGKLMALPQPEAIDAFMPLYRSRLLSWAGTPYAFPVLGDGPICVYRRDLYANSDNQSAYRDKYQRPLSPPETWDEFAEQAEFFAGRKWGGHQAGQPSLPPLRHDDDELCAAYQAVAAPFAVWAIVTAGEKPDKVRSARPFSFQYDVDTGEPRIAKKGFVEALKLFKRMESCRSKMPTTAGAMKSDQVALGYITLADLAAAGPEEAQRWGVIRIPGSRRVYDRDAAGGPTTGPVNFVPFAGAGAVLGIVPKRASQAAAAFDLLSYLSGPDGSTEGVHTPALGSGPFRDMHVDPQHDVGWLNYGLDDKQTALMRIYLKEVADPRVDNPALDLRIPGRASHIAALAEAVRAAIAGGDPAAALKSAADDWRKLDGNPATARAVYRQSVGLQP